MKRMSILILTILMLNAGVALAAKPVVGVAEFLNESHARWWAHDVGWELSGMVANELASTGGFRVVERSKLEPVLREQDLAASGRIAQGTGAKIGKLTGAQYLILGTVTSYEENTSGTGGGISFGGISLGGKKTKAYIAVDLRVVDTTTGEIDYVRTVEANSGGGGFNIGIFKSGFGGSLGHEEKTPAGRAIRAVIIEITDYLECAMVKQDSCMDEFDAKEERRREGAKESIDLM